MPPTPLPDCIIMQGSLEAFEDSVLEANLHLSHSLKLLFSDHPQRKEHESFILNARSHPQHANVFNGAEGEDSYVIIR